METKRQELTSRGIKLSIYCGEDVAGRATLFLMTNDLHPEPFGLLEDVYVNESFRNEGLGTYLVKQIIIMGKVDLKTYSPYL